MVNKEIIIPEIRFISFKEEWKQYKFRDLYKVISGHAFKRSDYIENGVPIINGESIQHEQIKNSNLNYLPEFFLDNYSSIILKTNDIVLGLNRPITNGKLKIAYIPKEFDNSLLYQRAGKISYIINIDTDFSFTILSLEILKFTQKEAVGSDQPFISTTKLEKWDMKIPSDEKEQNKIGTFFKQLNKIITLQQQLLNDHKQLKKAMLQKMFPQKGESVPRIRFAGFNDVWKKHRLGEYFDKYQNTIYLEDETRYKQITVKNTGLIEFRDTKFGKNIGRKRQYVIDTENYPNTLTFTRQTIYEGGIGFVPNILNGAIVTENMPLLNMKKTLFKAFIMAVLKSPSYYKNVIERNMPIGSAQKALHEKDWLNSYLFIPNIKEQEKIGNYFKQLDETIALHEQKLETYQELKKAMLQKMFV